MFYNIIGHGWADQQHKQELSKMLAFDANAAWLNWVTLQIIYCMTQTKTINSLSLSY